MVMSGQSINKGWSGGVMVLGKLPLLGDILLICILAG